MDWTEEQWRNSSSLPGDHEHCFVYDVNYSELEPGQIIPSGETHCLVLTCNIHQRPFIKYFLSLVYLLFKELFFAMDQQLLFMYGL